MVDVRVSLRDVLLSACLVTTLAGTAHADDEKEVVSRLTRHSDLSSSAAKKLVSKVNVRMAKAADATSSASDPMRAAVSLALFQSPQPPNSMAAAKVRLRLYAGLNEWALEAIFAPQPGVINGCVREVGASTSECEALVAAAAKQSVAQIRSVAGGSAPSAVAAAPGGNFGGGQPAAAGGSRFGRFSSGYQGGGQQYSPPQQQYGRPAQQFGGGYPQQQYGRPAAPAYQAPAPAPVSPQEAASRKDAYKAQREAYMARQKAAFEDRKAKVAAVHEADASEAPPRAGEGRDAVYEAPAAPASKPSSAPAKAASKAAAPSNPLDEPPAEAVAAKGGGKPALDNDFLDGLLDDPLANKGKK